MGGVGKELKFAGTVLEFSEGKVSIGSAAGESLDLNTTVLIKRKTSESDETTIAQGVVTRSDSAGIQADIRLYLDTSTPAAEDLVYAEAAGSVQ